ncbi:MAG: DUF4139 domain-containing protein [Pseudomonadota bacterium]
MTLRLAGLSLACLFSLNAFSASVASRVDSVVVYPQGATVTRVASVSLNAGVNDLTFSGLVNSIDASRLRVEVVADGVQIGQVKLEKEQQRDVLDAEIAKAQADIESVTEKIFSISDSTAAARLQLSFLQGIANGYGKDSGYEGSRGSADPTAWRGALDLLLTGSNSANQLIRENDRKNKQLQKDLSVLQRKLNNLRGGSLATTVVNLTLNTSRAVQTDVYIRYFQNNAWWSPSYEARLNSDNGELQLVQQANINQQTDENWSNVRLTLSTSEPSGRLQAPYLDSRFLKLYRPEVAAKERRAMASVANGMVQADQMQEIVVTGSRVTAPKSTVGGFAVTYDMPGRSTVTNDSEEAVTQDLASYNFETTLVTKVVPRESEQAFLTARFTYDQKLPLYSSNMTVFVDGVFAGNSMMPTALPQAEVELPMGQDRRIEVNAVALGDTSGDKGIVRKRRTEATDYIFTLTNRRATSSTVEVHDLYPVSRDKAIDVEVPKTATAPTETDIDDEPGLILWRKELASGENWQIRHQYTVSYPADSRLIEE